MKIFLFQFVNSYASFFFLAFVAKSINECPDGGCMSILGTNLAIIFGTRIVSGNISELLVPYVMYKLKMRKEAKEGSGDISRPEAEYMLDEVSGEEGRREGGVRVYDVMIFDSIAVHDV